MSLSIKSIDAKGLSANACAICTHTFFSPVHKIDEKRTAMRCDNCKLVQLIPRPLKIHVDALYSDEVEDFGPYIDTTSAHQTYFERKMQEISSYAHRGKGRPRLLDIGCATGIGMEEAKREGFEAEGLEVSHFACRVCQKKGLRVFQGTVEDGIQKKKVKKNSYDVVVVFEVIEHMYDPVRTFGNIYSLMKKNGYLFLTTPNHKSLWRRLMGKWWVGYRHPEHLYFFDETSLAALLTNTGFDIIEMRKDDARIFPLSYTLIRAGDYLPFISGILRALGKYLKAGNWNTPVNPWENIFVVAVKKNI